MSPLQASGANFRASPTGFPFADVQAKLRIVTELRESIETFQDDDHHRLVTTLAPKFFSILIDEQPAFISTSPVQVRSDVLAYLGDAVVFNPSRLTNRPSIQ